MDSKAKQKILKGPAQPYEERHGHGDRKRWVTVFRGMAVGEYAMSTVF